MLLYFHNCGYFPPEDSFLVSFNFILYHHACLAVTDGLTNVLCGDMVLAILIEEPTHVTDVDYLPLCLLWTSEQNLHIWNWCLYSSVTWGEWFPCGVPVMFYLRWKWVIMASPLAHQSLFHCVKSGCARPLSVSKFILTHRHGMNSVAFSGRRINHKYEQGFKRIEHKSWREICVRVWEYKSHYEL